MKMFWQHVKDYFDSQEARQIVSLVAFFLGRTPFDTMAIYSLLSYTEFRHDGYHNVEGGMYQIVEGMVHALQQRGATFHYNTEVTGVEAEGARITRLTDSEGNHYEADTFLINADAALFRGRVLLRKKFSEEKLRKMEWTMGYLTIYVGIDRKLPDLDLHNYFLGTNFEAYAHNVLKNPDSLQKPYYYVTAVSKHTPQCAPAGCERLFIVCPVPSLQFKPDWSDRDEIVDSILTDFSKRIGIDIMPHIVTRTINTPGMGETIQPLHGERPGTVAPAEPDRRPPPEEFRRGVRQPLLRGCLHHARSGTSHGGDQRRDGLQTDTEMLIFYIFATKIIAMQELRSLTLQEIERLQSQNCECADWTRVKVSAGFNPHFIKTPVFTER